MVYERANSNTITLEGCFPAACLVVMMMPSGTKSVISAGQSGHTSSTRLAAKRTETLGAFLKRPS
eukprot:1581280-Rhodomonas_salina.1